MSDERNEVTGWIIIRRQRRGSLFENAAGAIDAIEIEKDRGAAEAWRDSMTTPRDWDVAEARLTILPPSSSTAPRADATTPALRDVRVMLAASTVPCPGERCPMCSGEACAACGAGLTQYGQPNGEPCEHDVMERHQGVPDDAAAPSPRQPSQDETPARSLLRTLREVIHASPEVIAVAERVAEEMERAPHQPSEPVAHVDWVECRPPTTTLVDPTDHVVTVDLPRQVTARPPGPPSSPDRCRCGAVTLWRNPDPNASATDPLTGVRHTRKECAPARQSSEPGIGTACSTCGGSETGGDK